MGSVNELPAAIPVRVSDLNGIARVAGSIAIMKNPIYIMRFKWKGKSVYAMISIFRDYYEYNGVPMVYYYVSQDNNDRGKTYLLIRVDERGEQVQLSHTIRPGWAAVPILDLEEPPKFFPVDVLEEV